MVCFGIVEACISPLSASPIFNFTLGSGIHVGDQVYNGFVAAAGEWSALFTDNVTINVTIDYKSLGSNILGSTSNATYTYSYSDVRSLLAADASSSTDAAALAHLQSGNSLAFAVNHTSQCGNCSTPYDSTGTKFDNTNVTITGAEARALGLGIPSGNSDGSITFSSDYSFDFNPSDGISSGEYDFVGIAAHEIGHLLGFVSTVDDFDICGHTPSDCNNQFASENSEAPTALDLFRYSTDSGFGTVMDLSADNRGKYFSIDGGATLGPLFADGQYYGDGSQASHWKDNLGIGIMDPTAAPGERLSISQNDVKALDVIGWNVATPEPASTSLLILGGALTLLRRKYTRRNS